MPPESTISTTAAAAGTEDKPRYRSAIGPRSSSTSTRLRGIINPTSSTISTFSTSFVMPPPSATSTASLVRSTRERERRELVELNDRFANYVERVRFLEAQNKKLKMEAEGLRKQLDSNGAGSGLSRLREMYETELKEARALVDETARQKNDVELRLRKIEDEGADLRDQLESLRLVRSGERKSIDSLSRQVADNEAELGLLHRRIKDTDDEYRRQKAENQKLTAQIQSVMNELYQETALKLELQNEKQSLEEELSFLKQIHAQEIEEINSINQSADQGLDPSLFFKHELANAIRDIRDEYETLNQQQKQELEGWYRLKVTEAVQEMQARRPTESPISRLRDEEELRQLREQVTNSRKDAGQLRTKNKDLLARVSDLESVVNQERRQGQRDRDERDREIMDLRAKFEQVLAEYDDLVSSKTTLDTEIAVYRKLLESEEHRNRSPFEIDRQPSSPPPPPPPPQPTEMYPSQESIDGAFESVVEASVERSEDHQKPPKEPVTSVASSSSGISSYLPEDNRLRRHTSSLVKSQHYPGECSLVPISRKGVSALSTCSKDTMEQLLGTKETFKVSVNFDGTDVSLQQLKSVLIIKQNPDIGYGQKDVLTELNIEEDQSERDLCLPKKLVAHLSEIICVTEQIMDKTSIEQLEVSSSEDQTTHDDIEHLEITETEKDCDQLETVNDIIDFIEDILNSIEGGNQMNALSKQTENDKEQMNDSGSKVPNFFSNDSVEGYEVDDNGDSIEGNDDTDRSNVSLNSIMDETKNVLPENECNFTSDECTSDSAYKSGKINKDDKSEQEYEKDGIASQEDLSAYKTRTNQIEYSTSCEFSLDRKIVQDSDVSCKLDKPLPQHFIENTLSTTDVDDEFKDIISSTECESFDLSHGTSNASSLDIEHYLSTENEVISDGKEWTRSPVIISDLGENEMSSNETQCSLSDTEPSTDQKFEIQPKDTHPLERNNSFISDNVYYNIYKKDLNVDTKYSGCENASVGQDPPRILQAEALSLASMDVNLDDESYSSLSDWSVCSKECNEGVIAKHEDSACGFDAAIIAMDNPVRMVESQKKLLMISEEPVSAFEERTVTEGHLDDNESGALLSRSPPVHTRTAFKRNAKGPISLIECSSNGEFVVISNGSFKKTKDLTGWYLTQQSRGNPIGSELKYVFRKPISLEPNKKFKLFSEKVDFTKITRSKEDITCAGITSWLTGDEVVTKLYDDQDQEKACLAQTKSSH
ncbi:hypothetical protein ACOME3_000556 [Neoechinorhynchus agilis]